MFYSCANFVLFVVVVVVVVVVVIFRKVQCSPSAVNMHYFRGFFFFFTPCKLSFIHSFTVVMACKGILDGNFVCFHSGTVQFSACSVDSKQALILPRDTCAGYVRN